MRFVVPSYDIGWIVLVAVMEVVLIESAAHEVTFHRVPLRVVLRRGELVRSLLSLMDVVGCKSMSTSSSQLLAGFPGSPYPFCLV